MKDSWLGFLFIFGGILPIILLLVGVPVIYDRTGDVLGAFILMTAPILFLELLVLTILQYLKYREVLRAEIADSLAKLKPKEEEYKGKIVVVPPREPKKDIVKIKDFIVNSILRQWDTMQGESGRRIMSLLIFLILIFALKDILINDLKFDEFIKEMVIMAPWSGRYIPLIALGLSALLSTAIGSSFFTIGVLIPTFSGVLSGMSTSLQVVAFSAVLAGATFGNTVSILADVPSMHLSNLRSLYPESSEEQLLSVFRELRLTSLLALLAALGAYFIALLDGSTYLYYGINVFAALAITYVIRKRVR